MKLAMIAAASLGVMMLPVAASAQSAAENYSYKAPSGMFSEGTTKWQMYQFMAADAENRAKAQAGQPTSTGTLSTSSSNQSSYPRPGESTTGQRRPTAR